MEAPLQPWAAWRPSWKRILKGIQGPAAQVSGQNVQVAAHRPMDILRFGRIFRFLKKFLHPRHIVTNQWKEVFREKQYRAYTHDMKLIGNALMCA